MTKDDIIKLAHEAGFSGSVAKMGGQHFERFAKLVAAQEREALKQHINENKDVWLHHYSMLGDTQGGFYSQDDVDLEALNKMIDDFGAELRARTKGQA